eukprot:5027643-Amphidinium_carterae.1
MFSLNDARVHQELTQKQNRIMEDNIMWFGAYVRVIVCLALYPIIPSDSPSRQSSSFGLQCSWSVTCEWSPLHKSLGVPRQTETT